MAYLIKISNLALLLLGCSCLVFSLGVFAEYDRSAEGDYASVSTNKNYSAEGLPESSDVRGIKGIRSKALTAAIVENKPKYHLNLKVVSDFEAKLASGKTERLAKTSGQAVDIKLEI